MRYSNSYKREEKHGFSELIKAADPQVFVDSIKSWVANLSINSVIMFIMMIFMIVGAVDRIRGNKKGYGEKFEEGFNAMGALAIAMAGVVAAAPVLALLLQPIVGPVYRLLGADPSMFATTLLACDMAGLPRLGHAAGRKSGCRQLCRPDPRHNDGPDHRLHHSCRAFYHQAGDRPFLGAGILAGLITVPIGCIVGGLVMNLTPYKMDVLTILRNLIPVIIIAVSSVLDCGSSRPK